MKILYLIRHAKSSWNNNNISDIERPLNERGKKDAPFMAKTFNKKKSIQPELIAASPSKRTLTTAKTFCKEIDFEFKKVKIIDEIYLASLNSLVKIITSTDDKINSLALFGHNPGMTELVNHFSEQKIDNLPTCGIASFKFDTHKWKEVEISNAELEFLIYPKLF